MREVTDALEFIIFLFQQNELLHLQNYYREYTQNQKICKIVNGEKTIGWNVLMIIINEGKKENSNFFTVCDNNYVNTHINEKSGRLPNAKTSFVLTFRGYV